ncbi:MAG: PAS domain S-box protein [Ferruginibacter sp.]
MPTPNFDNHFKDLFENTNDLIHFLNIEGNIELVNPAWLTTLGYEFNEVVGRSIYDFIHQPCREEYKATRKKVIDEKVKADLVTTFITKHSKEVVGEGQISYAYDLDQSLYTRCVFKNITAKKIAEKKIEESEKRLKTFFNSGPDAVIVINELQQILEWNPKAEIIFGYSVNEVIGKPLSETIIPNQYREAHKRGMAHYLKTGEGPVLNKTIEITALHKKGHEFYINLSISNVKVDGEWLFIAFLSDITERKKTEEALIRKEAELLQAKLLEEKKDEFISIASHELKTPLTTIKAYAQLALSISNEIGPLKQYLTKVDQYANKLNVLLTELLDVSRINAGRLKLSQTEVEMESFIPEVVNSLQHITQTHKIILENIEPATVKIDTLRLDQVITNIISNAAKYSPGKDQIIINAVKKDENMVLSFKDFGIGIPKQKISKIFDRFYRVDEVSKEFSGLGIGLYISAEIIKQHGGKIWAESIEGEGSTFYLSLPL